MSRSLKMAAHGEKREKRLYELRALGVADVVWIMKQQGL